MRDPRPDLTEDTAPWDRLLRVAEALDGHEPVGLCGALRGLRCCGARLARGENGWRLEADKTYWTTPEEWTADTERWLMPHLAALRELLATLPNHNQAATAAATTEETQ